MSEGTAVPYVRRWAITQLQAATGLAGVRVQYSPITNFDQALGDNGNIEAVYWDRFTSSIQPRAFKGAAHIKYRETASSDLIVVVAERNADATLSDAEQRAANLVGEVVRVWQSGQPGSPGAHLDNISTYIAAIEADPGILASAGSSVYAASWRLTVHIEANVEQ